MPFQFDHYYDPRELYQLVMSDYLDIPDQDYFSERYKPLRETWCAAVFGIGYATHLRECKVSVNSDSFPDFFLKTNSNDFYMETTEVLAPGRRRHDEYRDPDRPPVRMVPADQFDLDGTKSPEWVRSAIERKVRKYGVGARSTHLVVYVNIHAIGFDLRKIREACSEYEASFSSIWLLTGKNIATLFVSQESRRIIGCTDGFGEVDI